MTRRTRWLAAIVVIIVGVLFAVVVVPALPGVYWRARSSNPIRRGVRLAQKLSCFSCHGAMGQAGVPDPGVPDGQVPSWGGGTWMMYVENDREIREFIRDGVSNRFKEKRAKGAGPPLGDIRMPAFAEELGGTDLGDLVATFKGLSLMSRPGEDSSAGRGFELARQWKCFSCHSVEAAGGRPNTDSLTGYLPGWWGADFRDLVRSREEFDQWVTTGGVDRLRRNAIARFFTAHQHIKMPAYKQFTKAQLDDLHAFALWLAQTEGGSKSLS